MISVLFLIIIIVGFPSFMVIYNYKKCKDKSLAFILDEKNVLKPILCKNFGEDFILTKEGAYRVDNSKVRHVGYPMGWPGIFQKSMPSFLYKGDSTEPLDWNTVKIDPKYHVSAREIGSILEPEWIRTLIKGFKEGASGGLSKIERIVLFVGAGAGVCALIFIFVLLTRK